MTQQEMFPEIPESVEQRIRAALSNQETSPCARAVLHLLKGAAGHRNAISISTLQVAWRACGVRVWSDRDVKAAVKELLEERMVPVGSARSGAAGYFLLCTPEDIDQAERPLVGEVKSLARRLRAINAKSEISRMLCGQLGIE